jgi:periplasmic protein TonB
MYETNESVVQERAGEPRPLRPTKRAAVAVGRGPRRPAVSANLSAGLLENNRMKRPKTAIDFFVSVTGHGLLVAAVILLPLYFSNALDLRPMETTYLVAPPPPPPPAPASVVHALRHPKNLFRSNKLYAPRVIPKHIAEIKDLPNAPQTVAGAPGGVIGGVPGGQLGGVLGGILGDLGHAVPPPPPKAAVPHGPYLVGGKVQAPRILREVQPVYPALAREARIQGTVVMDSVIDANGNVTQLKLVSGHPLLVTAAFNAVQQWKYEPTRLNGVPVAVEMHVTVRFHLGSDA